MATPSTLILPYTSPGAGTAGSSVKYSLVGRGMNRISYRRYNSAAAGCPAIAENDTTSSINARAQASIDIRTQVKAPGAVGNDRVRIDLKDTYLGSDGLYKTDSFTGSFSFSRDINSTAVRRMGIISQLVALLGADIPTKTYVKSNFLSSQVAQHNAMLTWTNLVRLALELDETAVP